MRKLLFVILAIFLFFPSSVLAYSTNMNASVVIGQTGFTGATANQGGSVGANTLSFTTGVVIIGSKLVVSDNANSRVLVFNTIPTSSNAAPDVVIGQADFTHGSANQGGSVGANTLNTPQGLATDGTKLFVADYLNRRVLIYNTVPTSNNASADVVIGQPDMQTVNVAVSQTSTKVPINIAYDSSSGKLIIADSSVTANRVLIYNQVPTTNSAPADVVVGQQNFTSGSANQGGSIGPNTLSQAINVLVANSKLLISDASNNRVLVFNSIPTSNNASADVVIGQADFTYGSANQGGSVGANTLSSPYGLAYDGTKLFVSETNNNRALIFSGIPVSNNISAYKVIGQADFTHSSANQGGSTSANTLNLPKAMSVINNQLFVPDGSNNRLLIFYNFPHTITASSIGSTTSNNGPTISGTVDASTSDTPLTGVQYQVDSNSTTGSWQSCTGTTSYSCTLSGLSLGSHTIYFRAYDNDSDYTIQSAYASVSFTVVAGTASTGSSDPNSHPGWNSVVSSGPSFLGTVGFIGDSNSGVLLPSGTSHDDLNITVSKVDIGSLLLGGTVSINGATPITIPVPWTQGFNLFSDIFNFSAISAFNGYPEPIMDHPFTIQLAYDPAKLHGLSPSRLKIGYFNPTTKRWQLLTTPIVVNYINHTLATTFHIQSGTGGERRESTTAITI